MRLSSFFFCILILGSLVTSSKASEPADSTDIFNDKIAKAIRNHIEGRWFLSYHYKKEENEEVNQFAIKRSYITLKHQFNENFKVRFTQDITIDEEGEDKGNVEMRLKYCYANFKINDFAFFYKPDLEVGLVHRPWNNFEENINNYRVQGPMFLNRSGLFSSADFGVTFNSLLGGELNKTYQKVVNDAYPGKYGSFSVGVYNGGGYHHFEQNHNKTIETRLTVRPFYQIIPGLQLTYFNAFGKGNKQSTPDYRIHDFFLSYEHRNYVVTAQLYNGKGNSLGKYSNARGKAYECNGYSVFGEYKFPDYKWSIFFRYDDFKVKESESLDRECFIWGVGYELFGESKMIFDMEYYDQSLRENGANFFYEIAMDINF
jgi:hypothetical protein